MKFTLNGITFEGTVEECLQFQAALPDPSPASDHANSGQIDITSLFGDTSECDVLEAQAVNLNDSGRKWCWFRSRNFYRLVFDLYSETHNVREVERRLEEHYVHGPSYPVLLQITRQFPVCPRR